MITGECPYCDESLMIPIADHCPAFQKHWCEHCNGLIWTYHSRFEPKSYTEEAFLEEFEVNEETKNITKKEQSPNHYQVIE